MAEGKAPTYNELGKLARDLLKRGYHPGIWQIETRTVTSPKIELFSAGHATHDNTRVNGMLQSKYKMEDQGLTFTEGWNTDKWLFGEIMQKDKISEGLMLALGARFLPSINEFDCKVKVGYGQEKFNVLAEMDLVRSPVLRASAVVTQDEFLGGAGLDYDIGNSYLQNWKFAVGYVKEPAALLGEIQRGRAWLASLFYKVNDQIDAAAEIGRSPIISRVADDDNPESQHVEVGGDMGVTLGMIYHIDENALVRAKINDSIEVGLGYEQKLTEGIIASVSTILNLGNFSAGNHKFGVGVAFQCE